MPLILGSLSGGMQPSAPTIGTATAGDSQASVAFTASSYIGKGTITYTATSSPGGFTATGASSPLTVTGLSNGTAYTFTVVGTTNYGVSSQASAASNSITPAAQGDYVSLSTVYLSGGAQTTITFSGIDQSYSHLQLRASVKSKRTGDYQSTIRIRFNSASTYNYSRIQNTASSANGLWGWNSPYIYAYNFCSTELYGANTGNFGMFVMDIYDYSRTTVTKAVQMFGGFSDSNNNTAGKTSAQWYANNNAITSISMDTDDGSQFAQYSKFALYGIKG